MKIVIASENQGKLKEIQAFFHDVPISVVAQNEYAVPAVEETGLSFIENAILKARHAAKFCQLPALGDDSGLVVDALNGAPGIYSARYAGFAADMPANIHKLLSQLEQVADHQRSAHYYCAIAFVRHEEDPVPIVTCAKWDGFILREEKGQQGFGYDPLFWLPSLQCTAAELDTQQKNSLSHRAQALKQFVSAFLQAYPVNVS